MTKIYIVQGKSGEYSDRTEWIYKAYTDEQTAKNVTNELCAQARHYYEKIIKIQDDDYDYHKINELMEEFKKIDKQVETWHWHYLTTYFLTESELV